MLEWVEGYRAQLLAVSTVAIRLKTKIVVKDLYTWSSIGVTNSLLVKIYPCVNGRTLPRNYQKMLTLRRLTFKNSLLQQESSCGCPST